MLLTDLPPVPGRPAPPISAGDPAGRAHMQLVARYEKGRQSSFIGIPSLVPF